MHPKPLLSLQKVSKHFSIGRNPLPVLENISLDLYEEEWIGLMGSSGSGKTTLLSLIAGLEKPSSGEILWKGKKLFYFLDIYPAYLRNHAFGFIFQDYRLLPSESVWNNILLPLRIRGWYTREDVQRAEWLLEEVNLTSYRHQKTGLLSGGQQQRLAIVRALVGKPKLLLADEALANLDEDTAEEVINLLKKIKKYQGFAMILVHHQKKFNKHCDRSYLLQKGRLVEL